MVDQLVLRAILAMQDLLQELHELAAVSDDSC